MNKYIAKYLIYLPIQYIRGQKVKEYLPMVKKVQFKPVGEIRKSRDKKLRKIVNYSYRYIPYYRKHFDELGVRPENIKRVEDLPLLPVLSKRDVLNNEQAMINPSLGKKLYTRKTGGSTGMTLHFKKEAKALALNDAIMYRCYAWYGIDIGDRQARFWGVPVTWKLRWKEQLKDFILNRIRISAFDISRSSCVEQYKRIKKFRPAYFYGYTTAIYGFCLFMKESGIDLNGLKLKAVICTAEKMYPHHRELFNEMFECPVVDEYGSAEHGIMAFQCKEGNMHMMADHLCIEFLDENDKPVKPGEKGRIVITDLDSYAMPLIRYDIGDIGKPTDKRCACGINLPLMEVVEGRKEDFIRRADGKLVHAAYLCYTLKDDTVHEFKMYQKAIDILHVLIVKSPLFTSESERILEKKLRTALGEDIKITFEYLERIPREKSGKLRYFVSELTK
ncbi:MAG: hypothetical protein AVO38_12770 [delta proteobacterium ML8_D]|nr:MAG: hypothetical protein AVO38_12770 [delta proteobacterium ML8_D]